MPSRGRPVGSSSKRASCSSSSSSTSASGLDSDFVSVVSPMARDGEDEPRVAASQLDRRLVDLRHRAVRVEALEHPADRRRAIRRSLGIDRSRDDQTVDRPRHRDVVQAKPLGALLVSCGLLHRVPGEHATPIAQRRMHHPEPEPPVRERDDLVRAARSADVAPGVRDDHDLELEALRGVDGQEPHGAPSLLLGNRLELLRAERILVAHEPHEALDVRAAHGLVVARQASELAEVRESSRPVPPREDGEVVVVLAHHALAESLEPDPRRGANQSLVALEERAQQARVARVELLGKRPLERREQRTALGVAPEKDERVVRDADERRREHGGERDVVVAVVKEPQVGEQVDDLLLPEVAAPRRAVRRKPLAAECLLVLLGVRARCEQHDDLARLGLAGVDQLAHATRNSPCLAGAPVLLRLGEARLVGDEQLDGMTEHGIGELRRRRERLVVVAERVAEEVVHRLEHLRSRAVVAREREQRGRLRSPLAEDLEIRVPEAVDRLELVADGEDLGEVGVRDEVDELALQPVRVLELVHHDHPEPQLRRLAHRRVVAEQIACGELEILEVDDRLTTLRRRVLRAEPLEQLLQEVAVRRGQLLERRPLHGLPRGLERGSPAASTRERRQIDELLRRGAARRDAKRLARVPTLGLGRRCVGDERLGLGAERRHRARDVGPLAQLELERASGGAKRLVDAREHAAKTCGSIGREQPEALGVAVGAERLERALERFPAEHGGARILELAEPRVEAGGERMGAQQAAAEAVNRRDPGAVELACEVGTAALAQRGPDARPKLAGRLARVGDDEDRLDVDAAIADRAHVALDENRRLSRSRAGGHEDRAFGLDRGELLLVQHRLQLDDRHARATRQIGQRSHHDGQPSPFGSCWTSPVRMRRAFSAARSRAVSIWLQNASSSR